MTSLIYATIFCAFLTGINAQTYTLAVSNEPFVFLENAQIAVQEAWTEPVFDIPIGFVFDFFDISSNRLYSDEDTYGGYTSLNQDQDHLYMLVHFVAFLSDRGYAQDSALSPIYYKTEGIAGQRVFTLEFNNAGLFEGLEDENSILLDYINIQVKLYEATGDIIFHYGPHSIQEIPENVFDPYKGPIVGLLADVENVGGGQVGEIMLLQGDPLNPLIVNDSIVTLTWPIPENTVYRFSRTSTSTNDKPTIYAQSYFSPNPSSGEIYLNDLIADQVIYPVRLHDLVGNQVGRWNSQAEISVAGLSSGVYYVMVQTNAGLKTEKLIILTE